MDHILYKSEVREFNIACVKCVLQTQGSTLLDLQMQQLYHATCTALKENHQIHLLFIEVTFTVLYVQLFVLEKITFLLI